MLFLSVDFAHFIWCRREVKLIHVTAREAKKTPAVTFHLFMRERYVRSCVYFWILSARGCKQDIPVVAAWSDCPLPIIIPLVWAQCVGRELYLWRFCFHVIDWVLKVLFQRCRHLCSCFQKYDALTLVQCNCTCCVFKFYLFISLRRAFYSVYYLKTVYMFKFFRFFFPFSFFSLESPVDLCSPNKFLCRLCIWFI